MIKWGDKREENHSETLDRRTNAKGAGIPGRGAGEESNDRGIRHTERDRDQWRGLYQAAEVNL